MQALREVSYSTVARRVLFQNGSWVQAEQDLLQPFSFAYGGSLSLSSLARCLLATRPGLSLGVLSGILCRRSPLCARCFSAL